MDFVMGHFIQDIRRSDRWAAYYGLTPTWKPELMKWRYYFPK